MPDTERHDTRAGAAGPATTRLAPSPTGALHLGNARTFLVNWALARQQGWRIVLRIEDLDTPRNKPGAIEQALDDLRWLGIDWDQGPIIQSQDLVPHREAMQRLAMSGRAYPSELSRSQIEAAASAPQEPAGPGVSVGVEVRFPAELRPPIVPGPFVDSKTSWRFATPDELVTFDDAFAGPQHARPARTIGDFVVWTAREQPSYQLAVVVDDARQGVTHVVRGDDLLDSAARQILLIRALGLGPPPSYTHLPLVKGPDGRRLAKRHGDTRLGAYRERGVPAERVIGLIAGWSGAGPAHQPCTARQFVERFRLASMPKGAVTFRAEDDAWLLHGS